MKGLFNKVKNVPTRRRFVVSTIRKGENAFETAVFAANFFYLPRSWSRPEFIVATDTVEKAWDTHYLLAARLSQEYPLRIFQEYS
ncbi:MAG: hypothetical protein A2Z73_02185 [Deltaproteobacteria bacterium RBG_13_60_28]|nr:MAG: hypothetical protein A2Z73_02185 [Deltaproteobacteria bacterium RBG_13_60_28]